jgi:non-ribosomal peptide synthase protein (TIGR01720 family)
VNSSVQSDQLVLNFTYSSRHFKEAGIEELAGLYHSALQEVIAHCRGREAAFTPSDYGLGATVTHEELDAFLNERNSGLDNILNF